MQSNMTRDKIDVDVRVLAKLCVDFISVDTPSDLEVGTPWPGYHKTYRENYIERHLYQFSRSVHRYLIRLYIKLADRLDRSW